ncbi:response regulator [Pseudomonas sp. MAFF 301449]|uniref:Response regulator n=1 Tax=Pseudomonas cyclaminis TaxID=2781239 RepID=A0ABR9T0E8_9PSED|nr:MULTISPECIES: response regulator [Pseudomonas]VVN29126.1 Nitrate/nitrite response regulator protein NarL [Pseudomonas fluorescens]MBB6291615.1 two-component system nitrate/nitrite response regulator NarL [Pseudomonas sp. SJZ073]MBB6315463.1 two-component system nitrate/nitrite response regulator NarL [Pseudomonas sp. JAI120]MBE8594658.1 response regulator [Pseudomonas cyclaminis]MBE8602747.1 response regulator [Pseudomonas cyclaminis]
MDCTTLLLIDDHPLFRKGLAQLFDASGDFEVVGQAASGREGINLAVSLTPQQVLLDLHMPGLSGLQVLDELRQLRLDCQVVVLTASMDRAELLTALRLGASGYVLKETEPDALLAYMRNCHKGAIVLDSTLIALLADQAEPTQACEAAGSENLTEREGQTLALIAAGMSNKQIGRELGISDGTVKIYVRSLLQKLGLHSRLELAAWVHSGALMKHEERH